MKRNKVWGALVVYVEEIMVPEMLKTLKYPEVDVLKEDRLKDACGTLANLIAGGFKNEMKALGFPDMEMSHFTNYRNSALVGVDFYKNQAHKYVLDFMFGGVKRLVLELTMGPIPIKKK